MVDRQNFLFATLQHSITPILLPIYFKETGNLILVFICNQPDDTFYINMFFEMFGQ